MDGVRVWMSAPPVVAHETMTLPLARQLLAEQNIRRLPVVNQRNELVGIVTEGDINRISDAPEGDQAEYRPGLRIRDLPLREFMRRPVLTVSPSTCLREAAQVMITHHIHGLPVVLEKQVVGVITVSDLLRWMVESETEDGIVTVSPPPVARD